MKTKKEILERKYDEIMDMVVATEAEIAFLKKKDPEYEMMNQFGGKQKISAILEDYETALTNHNLRIEAIKEMLKCIK